MPLRKYFLSLILINLAICGYIFGQKNFADSLQIRIDTTLKCTSDSLYIYDYEYGHSIDSLKNKAVLLAITSFLKNNPTAKLEIGFYGKCKENGFPAIDYTRQRAENFNEKLLHFKTEQSQFNSHGLGINTLNPDCMNCECPDNIDDKNESILLVLSINTSEIIDYKYKVVVDEHGEVKSASLENYSPNSYDFPNYDEFKSKLDTLVFDYKFEHSNLAEQSGMITFRIDRGACLEVDLKKSLIKTK